MARLNLVKSSPEVPESLTSQLSLSKIKSATDNRPDPFSITWPEFVESFRVPVTRGALPLDAYLSAEKSVRDQQKDGPAIIPGAYTKPGTRKQEDQESLSMVTLDIDEDTRTIDELCAALDGFEVVVHTSYSHSPDKPKHRAFILLKQPITGQIKPTLERIIDFFDDRIGNIDPCCRKPGQLFFTPACPPGGEAFYQFRHLAGTPLDPADFPEVPAQAQGKAAPSAAAGTATKPGEDYSAKESCGELLELCGWQRFYSTGSVTHYTRPGKNFGISATVFHESKNLYIHTSAPEAAPFECGKSYTPFGAYALIHHGGDHAAAARDLGRQGYGDQAVKQTAPGEDPEGAAPAAGAVKGAAPGRMIDLSAWGAEQWEGDPPERKYLVSGRIPLGVAVMVAAMGGLGKSFMLLELALHVATGKGRLLCPAMGGYVEEFGSAVFITAEEDKGEVHSRLNALDPKGRRFDNPGKLIVVPLPDAGGPVNLVRQSKDGLTVTPEFEMLRAQLKAMPDLKVIIFDPLQNFVQANISADNDAGQFACAVFAQLAAETGATVILAHHMRKPSSPIVTASDAREAIRGVTALVDGVRLTYALWPVADEAAKKLCRNLGVTWRPSRIVAGAVVKVNGKADEDVTTFLREDCGVLRDASSQIGVVEAKQGNQGDLMLELEESIRIKASGGLPFTKTGQNGIFARRSEHPESLRIVPRRTMDSMIEELLGCGRVVTAIHGKGTVKTWLDVPGGPFASGNGTFTKGA